MALYANGGKKVMLAVWNTEKKQGHGKGKEGECRNGIFAVFGIVQCECSWPALT